MIAGDFCYGLSSVAINIARFWTEREGDGWIPTGNATVIGRKDDLQPPRTHNIFVIKIIRERDYL